MSPIPQFAQAAWEEMSNDRNRNSRHPGLSLYRFIEPHVDNRGNRTWGEPLNSLSTLTPDGSRILVARQKSFVIEMKNRGYGTVLWRQTALERLALGLGIPSPTENGLFLDHTWGLPLIPGSSLKGIAQDEALAAAATPYADVFKNEFVALFGAQNEGEANGFSPRNEARRGHVIFCNAVPVLNNNNNNPFDVDIVNPHYHDYYSSSGKTAPADYLKPEPHPFLCVKSRTVYQFAVATHGVDRTATSPLARKAASYLQDALKNIGVGGKTGVGLGHFGDPTDIQV